MNVITITNKSLDKLRPSSKPYFIRDSSLKGFGVKVNQTGSIKFIAEVWHQGQSKRKTLGEYPLLTLNDAKLSALRYISNVKSGQLEIATKQEYSLKDLLDKYTSHGRLNHRTVRDYKVAVTCYLSDWLEKPVASITKQMVESRFYEIKDKGISGGKPTYSQATKTMRILSALMNYAMADELIESNPVHVLKLKRIDRSIQKRENYLQADKVRELLHITAQDAHPMTLAVLLSTLTEQQFPDYPGNIN